MRRDFVHDRGEAPAAGGPSSANLVLHVGDVDATRARRTANGAAGSGRDA